MRISDPIRSDSLTITFEKDDVIAMLNKDEETLNEFAVTLDKWKTWIDDVKRIRTKEMLAQK